MKPIITFIILSLLPFFAWAQLGTIDPAFSIGTGAGSTFTQKRIETMVQLTDREVNCVGFSTISKERLEAHCPITSRC